MGETIPSQASVFTTLRWENGRVAWLTEHLERLQEHAQRLGELNGQMISISGSTPPQYMEQETFAGSNWTMTVQFYSHCVTVNTPLLR